MWATVAAVVREGIVALPWGFEAKDYWLATLIWRGQVEVIPNGNAIWEGRRNRSVIRALTFVDWMEVL